MKGFWGCLGTLVFITALLLNVGAYWRGDIILAQYYTLQAILVYLLVVIKDEE